MAQENDPKPKSRYRIILITFILIAISIAAVYTLITTGTEQDTTAGIPDSTYTDSARFDSAKMDGDHTVDTTMKMTDTTKMESGQDDPIPPSPHHPIDTVANTTKILDSLADRRSKTGTLGYHYDPEMNIHESQVINVILTSNKQKSAIRDTLVKIIRDEDPDRAPSDTGKIEFRERIPLYKFVSLDLTALDSGIVVTKTPDSTRQLVDTVGGNMWSWSIYAKSAEKEESKLLLTVKSEKPNSVKYRYIRIRIHVESNVIRIAWNYLLEHPGDFILKIIVPSVAAIWGVIFLKRRKKGSRNDSGDSDS